MGDLSNKYQKYLEEFDSYAGEFADEEPYTYSEGGKESNPGSVDLRRVVPVSHVQKAEEALRTLKQLKKASDWKKAFSHKTGITVWTKHGTLKNEKIPVIKGQGVIKGFNPQTVFEVIGMRQHWDDWYEEGNLVENLNSSTSLTYMVMQALTGSKARDLCLVEKIECTSSGTIYFVSTSVETLKVPHVANRIRAHMDLNGWILEPVQSTPPSTKVTYILQTEVKGWLPSFAVNRYLLRRPLVIHTIDLYLQKHEASSEHTYSTGNDVSKKHSTRAEKYISESNQLKGKKTSILKSSEGKSETTSPPIANSSSSKSASPTSTISKRSKISKGTTEPIPVVKTEKAKEPSISDNQEIQTSISDNQEIQTSISDKQEIETPVSDKQEIETPVSDKQEIETPVSDEQEIKTPVSDEQEIKTPVSDEQEIKTPVSDEQEIKTPVSDEQEIQPPPFHQTDGSTHQVPSDQELPSPMASGSQTSLKSPAPTHQQHRHSEAVKTALATFKGYAESLDGWQLHSENKGVKIYLKDAPGKSMPIMRGEATISGGWTAEEIVAIINDMGMRTLWDDRFEEGHWVEQFGPDEVLLSTSMKGIFPISGRDLSIINITQREASGFIWNVGKSVIDPLIPENKSYTRAQLNLVGWFLRPHFDSSGYTTSVDVTYIVDIDIKLDAVPTSILKKISLSTPMCIAKVGEVLNKFGYPPYIRYTGGRISSSVFSPNNSKYDASLDNMKGTFVELCVSRKMYPSGFDITVIPEDSNVELLPNNTEVVRISVPENVNSNTLNIKLTKQTSHDKQLTINGQNRIPMATDPVNTNSAASTLVNPPTFKAPTLAGISTKTVEGIQKPPPFDKKQNPSISPKTRAITAQTFTPPTPLEKESKHHDEIPKVIAALTARGTAGKSEKSVTTTTYIKSVLSSTIDYQKLTETYTSNRRNETQVISNQARFNSQQVGLMFASMLLAYYAGKLSGSPTRSTIAQPSSTSSLRSLAASLFTSFLSVSSYARVVSNPPVSFLFLETKPRALRSNGSWIVIVGGLVMVFTLVKYRKRLVKRQFQEVQQESKTPKRQSPTMPPSAIRAEPEVHQESGGPIEGHQQNRPPPSSDRANHSMSALMVYRFSATPIATITTIGASITLIWHTLTYYLK